MRTRQRLYVSAAKERLAYRVVSDIQGVQTFNRQVYAS